MGPTTDTTLVPEKTIDPTDSNDRAPLDSVVLRIDHLGISGRDEDLHEAIQLLDLLSGEQRIPALLSIGNALHARFRSRGDLADLSSTIAYLREAVTLARKDHKDRPRGLILLGSSLTTRFSQTRDPRDIKDALELHREAVGLCPPGHAEAFATRRALGGTVTEVYVLDRKNTGLIQEAVSIQRDALAMCPDDPRLLSNLANSLGHLFKRSKDIQHQDEAIAFQRRAFSLTPLDDPQRSRRLGNLANSLEDRFKGTKNVADLDEITPLLQEAADLCLPGSPRRARRLHHLARGLLRRWRASRGPGEDELTLANDQVTEAKVTDLLKEACADRASPMVNRLDAADYWRYVAWGFIKPESELESYVVSLNLLDTSVSRSESLEKQYDQLSSTRVSRTSKSVAVDGAALAIQCGKLELAVELLEQGRAMMFGQLGRYRTPLDEVEVAAPELASKFATLSKDLDDMVVLGPASHVSVHGQFEDDASRYHRVYTEWAKTLADIRALQGFQSFLKPLPFSDLQKAAEHGAVVVVNISKRRSDAIILRPTSDPILIPLPHATPEGVQKIVTAMGPRPAEMVEQDAVDILREIWRVIVEPVVLQLRRKPSPLPFGSRVWWCPTGAASRLPLHAAGPYAARQRDLPHIFTSSYTPTLGALIRSRKVRRAQDPVSRGSRTLLIVSQPATPGEKPLPSAVEEKNTVSGCVSNAEVLDGPSGTRDAVLVRIPEHDWLHLTCHGHHNSTQPFLSHFSLFDKSISLLDVVQHDLPKAEVAVLSACHSARVSEHMPDEVLHPAAGMLFAGFRSVVGTMWAMEDSIGPGFAKEFYKEMLDGQGQLKPYAEVAYALRKAVNALGMKRTPLVERINLVHFGA